MQDEPPPEYFVLEPIEKRYAVPIPPCSKHSDCETPKDGDERDLVAECMTYYVSHFKDES